MNDRVEVREAAPADWPQMWRFMHAIIGAGDTFAYDPEMSEDQARESWVTDPHSHAVVAVDQAGAVLGTANMHANHGGPGAHVASASYMVDPARWGQGVGRALVEHTLEWAREQGFRAIQFNAVAETNTRAIALYESLGFEVLATVPEGFRHPTEGYVGLCIMHRPL